MTTRGELDREALLALLSSGAGPFNEWRRAHPEAAIDLSGATLAEMTLDGVFFSGVDLSDANLFGASLRSAVFSGATLCNTFFVETDLRNATFGPPDLVDASLASSPLGARLMRGAMMSGAVFSGARLEQASFRECDLADADFSGCSLASTDLRGASLDRAMIDDPSTDLGDPTDTDALWAVLGAEPFPVRSSVMRSVFLLALADGRFSLEENELLQGIAHHLGMDQAAIDELTPRGQIVLAEVTIEAPTGGEAKSAWMKALAALVAYSAQLEGGISHDELNVVGHVGRKLGCSREEVAAVLSDALGVPVLPSAPA